MSVIRRYGTSALGSVLHTVAGLSAIAFGCLLVAVAAFLAPSLVGELGLNLLVSGGTVAENVAQLKAETFVSLPVLGLGLVAAGAIYVAGKRAGDKLHAIGTGRSESTATNGAKSTGGPPGDSYLRRFERSNLWAGLVLAGLLVTALVIQAVVGGSGGLAILAGLLQFAMGLFGGPVVLAVASGAFLCVWYGLRASAREAVVAGIGLWGLIGLVGLVTLLRSAAGLGLVVGGFQGVYYGVRAWGATELTLPVGEYLS